MEGATFFDYLITHASHNYSGVTPYLCKGSFVWWNTQHWRCQRVNARVLVFTSLQLVPGRVYCVFRELVKYVALTVSVGLRGCFD